MYLVSVMLVCPVLQIVAINQTSFEFIIVHALTLWNTLRFGVILNFTTQDNSVKKFVKVWNILNLFINNNMLFNFYMEAQHMCGLACISGQLLSEPPSKGSQFLLENWLALHEMQKKKIIRNIPGLRSI